MLGRGTSFCVWSMRMLRCAVSDSYRGLRALAASAAAAACAEGCIETQLTSCARSGAPRHQSVEAHDCPLEHTCGEYIHLHEFPIPHLQLPLLSSPALIGHEHARLVVCLLLIMYDYHVSLFFIPCTFWVFFSISPPDGLCAARPFRRWLRLLGGAHDRVHRRRRHAGGKQSLPKPMFCSKHVRRQHSHCTIPAGGSCQVRSPPLSLSSGHCHCHSIDRPIANNGDGTLLLPASRRDTASP